MEPQQSEDRPQERKTRTFIVTYRHNNADSRLTASCALIPASSKEEAEHTVTEHYGTLGRFGILNTTTYNERELREKLEHQSATYCAACRTGEHGSGHSNFFVKRNGHYAAEYALCMCKCTPKQFRDEHAKK